MKGIYLYSGLFIIFIFIFSCRKENSVIPGKLQLETVKVGNQSLSVTDSNKNVPIDKSIVLTFSSGLDTVSAIKNITIHGRDSSLVQVNYSFSNTLNTVNISPVQPLLNATSYLLVINSGLQGAGKETFPKINYSFTTVNGNFFIKSIAVNGVSFMSSPLLNINPAGTKIDILFTQPIDASKYQSYISWSGVSNMSYLLSDSNKMLTVSENGGLQGLGKYTFSISGNLRAANGYAFTGFSNSFYTAVDSTPKFPVISDDSLLTLVQKQTFSYFWDFAHPACGMARERNTSGDIVTTGGSGFGVMALIVGMHRGFITRSEGLARLGKILGFLETCDRFHGAWPHWMNGNTGKVAPFSTNDDGADIVETSYMVMGLLTMRQYLDSTSSVEKPMIDSINSLCRGVEYDWFARGGDVLYWNWSPDQGWAVNVKVQGYNETLITYILAAASTTHPISANVYHSGYAQNGAIVNGSTYYGYPLPLGGPYGGPLFFTQYTYLGLDPRNLKDQYADYWQQNVNQSLINQAYCVNNPKHYAGYGADSWGLTASDNPSGYAAQSPTNDLGVITPTAAVSALPYTPEQSMNAIRYFYYTVGDRLWGPYGFYDAYDPTANWWATSDLAIDEGPIVDMIENYRSQLLWNLFMSCPEIKAGLNKLGFTY